MSLRVGLIGARGYVGRELLSLIAGHLELELIYASSREWAGRPVAEMLDGGMIGGFADLRFEALGPEEAAAKKADVVFLGLPNGKAAPFVEAIAAANPETILIDLSADYRHDKDWTYGLPERNRIAIKGARLIANPGCYATAAQLALLPLKGHLAGEVNVFGISGYSGAGTTPSRKNDPVALKDNVIPYGLVGHGHEKEIAEHSGEAVRFMPSVASFFRGLVVTVSATLAEDMMLNDLHALFGETYAAEPFVNLSGVAAEPAAIADTHGAIVSLPQMRGDGRGIVVTAALDNLLKGAASQAIENLNIAMGWTETMGLRPL